MSLTKRRFISRLWVALIEQQENDVFKVLSTNWLDAVNVSLFKFKPGYQLYSRVLNLGAGVRVFKFKSVGIAFINRWSCPTWVNHKEYLERHPK